MTRELHGPVPTRRILVVANATAERPVLHEVILARAGKFPTAEVLVVAPALNSRLRHWISDEDDARVGAERRLRACLERLQETGIDANGMVGDADPLQAIADGLHWFAADELIVATHPEGRSHWLARNLVGRARARHRLPILHVVVDVPRGREYVASAA